MVVIIAILFKVSPLLLFVRRRRHGTLVLVSVHLRTAKLRPSAPTLALCVLFIVLEAMCPVWTDEPDSDSLKKTKA